VMVALCAGPALGDGDSPWAVVEGPGDEGPVVSTGGVTLSTAGDSDAAADGAPRGPTIIRAPATPIRSAQITPRTIDTFLQILSSTPLLLSDPSTVAMDPR
jgi:hypothetical protein